MVGHQRSHPYFFLYTFKILSWTIILLTIWTRYYLNGSKPIHISITHHCFGAPFLSMRLCYQEGTLSHLKSFIESAVTPIRLFRMIIMIPLKRCVVKENYLIALLRNEDRNIFWCPGPDYYIFFKHSSGENYTRSAWKETSMHVWNEKKYFQAYLDMSKGVSGLPGKNKK